MDNSMAYAPLACLQGWHRQTTSCMAIYLPDGIGDSHSCHGKVLEWYIPFVGVLIEASGYVGVIEVCLYGRKYSRCHDLLLNIPAIGLPFDSIIALSTGETSGLIAYLTRTQWVRH